MSQGLRHGVRALRAEVAHLRAQLALVGIQRTHTPRWAAELCPGRVAVLGALLDVYPSRLDAYTLEEACRTRDSVV